MLVLGAGVDVVYGVPTLGTLMPELAAFARGEGLKISKALRSKLPHLRFTFDKYAADQGDALIARLFANGDEARTLRAVAEKLRADPDVASVGVVIERLCSMAEENQLSGTELKQLARLADETGDVGSAEPLLDPDRITLTSTPGRAVRNAFQQALLRGSNLTEQERDTLELFVVATSNIEQLLSLYFTRYTIGSAADRKTYLYLSWMFWAFLRLRSVNKATGQRGIYQWLPQLNGDIITFNYTNFFDPITLRRVKFFHGRLDQYLRIDSRRIVTASDDRELREARDVDGIVKFVSLLRLDVNNVPAIDMPAIVPPVSFKPVMSREQLRTWMECDHFLQRAGVIVVIGYSFAMADEHFNDLLRNCPAHTRLAVVNTNLAGPVQAACRILGIDGAQVVTKELDGCKVVRAGRLVAIEATAEVLDEALLEKLLAL